MTEFSTIYLDYMSLTWVDIQCCQVQPVSNNQSLPDGASNRILRYLLDFTKLRFFTI